MGVIFKTKLSSLKQDDTARIDAKFHSLMNITGYDIFKTKKSNLTPLKNILKPSYQLFAFDENENYFGVPTGSEFTNEFGDLTSTQIITKDEHPDRLRYKVDENCILISSLKGARAPAMNFDFDLSKHVFSNGFYIFQVDERWNKKFVLYLLRTNRLKYVLDNNLYRGIGISSYKQDDFLRVLIPEISTDIQDKIVDEIQPIEKEINALRNSKLKPSKIINQAFAEYFRIDLNNVDDLEKIRILNVSLSSTKEFNSALRSGLRWNKMQYIQTHLYSEVDCIHALGRFIKSTKNGWSPLSVEDGEGIPVLGQENFSVDGILKIEPSKATEETRNNIEDFFIKKGDFFVSRGNTVDLVALASIVNEDIEADIIFPDLYIRLELDETLINKEFLSYIFNSFFGRLYFKYVAKGKNQTMVKVSSAELLNFRLPIPTIQEQEKLVSLIKTQLDEQKISDRQIEEKQQEINKIIEDAIKEEQANA